MSVFYTYTNCVSAHIEYLLYGNQTFVWNWIFQILDRKGSETKVKKYIQRQYIRKLNYVQFSLENREITTSYT